MTEKELHDQLHKTFNPGTNRVSAEALACETGLDLTWHIPLVIRFDNCVFDREVYLTSFKAGSEVIFSHCIFNGPLTILHSENSVTYKLLFSQFNNGFSIEGSDAISIFMGGTQGRGAFLIENAKFDQCSFEGFAFDSNTADDTISFFNSSFKIANFKEVVLSNASFNKSFFESDVTFDRAVFNYTTAPGTGNFFNTVFHGAAYFNTVNFTKGAMFNGAIFQGIAIFVGCNYDHYNCVADYSGCKFEKKVFFDFSWFKTLVIKNAVFQEVASFNSIRCSQIKLNKSVFLQYADFLDASISEGSRDSFRTIKNEFLRHNNNVEALLYQSKELRVYESSLEFRKHPKEKVVLWLYKISNDFGVNWLRGIGFTLLVSILFYLCYILSLDNLHLTFKWQGWNNAFMQLNFWGKNFFKFFIITHDLDFVKAYSPNILSYFIDTVGRIFIGYGLYQTVQAFRKYGK